MAPKPVATSRPVDIGPAWRRPMLSIAIAVAEHGALQIPLAGAEGVEPWTETSTQRPWKLHSSK